MDEEKIFTLVSDTGDTGCTITEIVSKSQLPRSVVRILLARLEGAGKILFKNVGMAKIYVVKDEE